MSETVSGLVEVIRKNDAGFYAVKLGDAWFGAGKYEPKFNVGDEVSFDFTTSADGRYKNMVFKGIQILEKGKGAPASSSSTSTPATSSGSGGTNWDLKDKRITYLACRKDALVMTQILVSTDAITLPAKKSRMEFIEILVRDKTQEMYTEVYGVPFEGEV